MLLNVMDDASCGNFTTGAVMRQGPLTIAISTSGCAPALAVRLRQQLAHTFGPEYALFLTGSGPCKPLAAQYPDFSERRARWYALVDSRSSPGSSRAVSIWPVSVWQKSLPTIGEMPADAPQRRASQARPGEGLLIFFDHFIMDGWQAAQIHGNSPQVCLGKVLIAVVNDHAHQSLDIIAVGFEACLQKPDNIGHAHVPMPVASSGVMLGANSPSGPSAEPA